MMYRDVLVGIKKIITFTTLLIIIKSEGKMRKFLRKQATKGAKRKHKMAKMHSKNAMRFFGGLGKFLNKAVKPVELTPTPKGEIKGVGSFGVM
jgi:hypothetical protein